MDYVDTVHRVDSAEPLASDLEPLPPQRSGLSLLGGRHPPGGGLLDGGAVAASYRPWNPVGWVLCSIGLVWGAAHFTSEYATYALLAAPGSLPAAEVAAWIYSWVWVPGLGFIVFLPLLFPNGRLPSLAGVPSRGSAYCWWGRERSWLQSLRDRALALASGILSGWRVYRTSMSSFRRSCSS